MMQSNSDRPRVLIEDWLPITELGIESRRERAAASALPPLSFLHLWWARRPLVASAAVVAAGLLPAWSTNLADAYPEVPEVQTEAAYHRWFLDLIGIWGDPIMARKAYDAAVASGIRIPNPYTYKQAYKNQATAQQIALLHRLIEDTWGGMPLVSDPTAGGGSIPFVSARLGLPTCANDINPIAASVIKAGVEYPATYGNSLTPHLRKWGQVLIDRIEERMKPYFPSGAGENVATYMWVNAVRCPRTGRWVPLMGNKWLRKDVGKEVAVVVHTTENGQPLDTPRFEVVTGPAVDRRDADQGFVARGVGTSPYDNLVIDGDYIKAEAQAGRMKPLLYAVAIRDVSGARTFRSSNATDLDAVEAAEAKFEQVKTLWQSEGVLPTEAFPDGNDMRPVNYGMSMWLDMFTPRQALVHGTFGQVFAELVDEVRADLDDNIADAVLFELALMQGKAVNYNSKGGFWDNVRQKIAQAFSRHNFAFRWQYCEFEGASSLYSWCLDQLVDAYSGITTLLSDVDNLVTGADPTSPRPGSVLVTCGGAASMPSLADKSVTHVCIDPPYYDNVMYAELADFFYVWEKRTLGRLEPGFFTGELTDKDNEAVANPARFASMGRRKKELATLDYQAKMTAIFAEARRALRDDGVMSVMFTHKRADAWDTLGASLLTAGFTIETSWPVNTEAENSMHQANMNSAASTIMLVCRKRTTINTGRKVFLDDIDGDIRTAARDAVTTFRQQGIDGVDLLLSTYGPVLSVISENWPVYSMTAAADGSSQMVSPEAALDIAREEVVRLQRARIIGHDTQIDAHTDFVLMAWETFKAPEFPFDEARRLALATGGLDVKELERAKILTASAGKVTLLPPGQRVRRAGGDDNDTGVRLDATRFAYSNDAVDTVLHIADVDGFGAAKQFMDRLRLTTDPKFVATLQGLANAIPRTKVKGQWVVPQAGLLDTLITAYFPDLDLPPVPTMETTIEQTALFDTPGQ